MPVCGVPCSLSLKQQQLDLFGSSLLLPQRKYVLLRLGLAVNSLYWVINSVRVFHDARWPIFLSHLNLALQTLYFFLALGSAARLWVKSGREREFHQLFYGEEEEQRESRPANGRRSRRGASESVPPPGEAAAGEGDGGAVENAPNLWQRLQWGLLYACADASVLISVVYWLLLYNGWLGALNFQLHLFNSLLMILDVFVGALPFEWKHMAFVFVYGTSYLLFDMVYFFASEAGEGEPSVIYDFLDWKHSPGEALTVVAALLLFGIPSSHGLFVLIARARDALRRRYPNLGWQGTNEEEHERVLEVSGMLDADVWAPLTDHGDPDLYDSEEEEMGGAAAFFMGRNEEALGARVASMGKGARGRAVRMPEVGRSQAGLSHYAI